jgi:O-antigen ligase
MAMSFPLLGLVAAWPGVSARQRNTNQLIALGGAILLVPLVLITGSRAGLVLMVIGAMAGIAIYRSGRPLVFRSAPRRHGRQPNAAGRWLPLALTAGLIGLVGLTVLFSRAEAVQRLFKEDVSQEIRLRLFGTMLQIGNDYAPFGAGFGTFDPVFRSYEPLESLSPLYVNHAHNDLLEIYIEGGLVALALLVAFLVWVGLRSAKVWRPVTGTLRIETLAGRAGSTILLLQLIASLADYPLRTPAHAVLAAVACAMLAAWPVGRAKTFDGR